MQNSNLWYLVFSPSFPSFLFLVACTRLDKPLCQSVRWSVGRSVCLSHFTFFIVVAFRDACARLMAIGLVFLFLPYYLPFYLFLSFILSFFLSVLLSFFFSFFLSFFSFLVPFFFPSLFPPSCNFVSTVRLFFLKS